MATGLEYALRITADGSIFAGEVKVASGWWDKFASAAARAKDQTGQAGRAGAQAGKEIKQSGDDAASAASGVDRYTASLGGMISKLIAAVGIAATIKQGLSFNSQIEDATISMGAMIAAQNEIRDGQGNLLEGAEAFNVAMQISGDQLKKLQIEGVRTTATFSELVTVFKGILAPAQAVNLSIDEARRLTISMTQVANALNVPMAQVDTEVRSILQGTIRQEHQLKNALGLSNELVKEWKEAGTLMQNLEERSRMFAVAGQAASKTWSGMLAGLKETITQFAGGITKDLGDQLKAAGNDIFENFFDLKTMKISDKLTPLISSLNAALGGVGGVFAKGMTGLLDGAIKLGEWIDKNKDSLAAIGKQIGNIWDKLTSIAGSVAKVVLGVGDWLVKSGALETALGVVAGALGVILNIINDTVEFFSDTNSSALALAATIVVVTATYYGLTAAAAAYAATSKQGFADSIKGVANLKGALGVLTAAFIGLEIGKYLRENFLEARLAGIALINGLMAGWEYLKYGVKLVWAAIETNFNVMIAGVKMAFGVFLAGVAEGLSHIPKMGEAAAALKAYADEYLKAGANVETYEQAQVRLARELVAEQKEREKIIDQMVDDEIQTELLKKSKEGLAKAAAEGAKAGADWELKNKAAAEAASEAARQAAEAWEKFVDSVAKKAYDAFENENGWTNAQEKELKALIEAFISGKISVEVFERAYDKLYKTTAAYSKEIENLDRILGDTKSLEGRLNALNDHIKTIGLDKVAIEKLKLREAEEELATRMATSATKEYVEEAKKRIEVQKKIVKATIIGSIKEETEAIKNEIEKLKEHNDTAGLNREQTEKLRLARMELRLEQMQGTDATREEIEAMKDLIATQKKMIEESKRGDIIDEAMRKQKEYEDKMKETAKVIEQSLTDALMRGFESGKGFAQNFCDTMKNMLKTIVLKPIIEGIVKQVSEGLFGKDGKGGALSGLLSFVIGGQNGGGILGSIMSMFGGGGGGGSLSGFASFGTSIASMFGGGGATGAGVLGGSQAGGGMSAMMTNPYFWIVAAVASAMAADANLYQKGWRIADQSSNVRNTPAKISAGLSFIDPGLFLASLPFVGATWGDRLLQGMGLGGKFASVLTGSSLFTRVFGLKKPQARGGGVEGNLTMDGFTGRQFQDFDQAGGFLRRGRHWTEWDDIDPDLQRMIDQTIGKVPGQIKKLLGKFQIDFNDVFGEDWSQKFHIVLTTDGKWENLAEMFDKETTRIYRELATTAVESIREGWGKYVEELKDLTPDEFREQFSKIIESLAILDNLKGAQQRIFGVYGLIEEDFEKYAETGEKIYETISRLAQTFRLTNQFSDFTGIKFNGLGLDSAESRQALIDDAGGPEAFAELFGAYWDQFASETQRFELASQSLLDIFDEIGVSVPRTTEEFKQLLASCDMSTAAGREMALQLLQVAPAFQAVIGAIENMSQAMSKTIDDLRRSVTLDGLSNQEKYNALKKEADEAYAAFQTATDPAEIQKQFDIITRNMSEAWNLLTDEEKAAKRAEYLAKLDELEASKNERMEAIKDTYLGVSEAVDGVADAGNKLAQAILDVAGQLGADISGVTIRQPVSVADEVSDLSKPMIDDGTLANLIGDMGDLLGSEIADVLTDAVGRMTSETKPLLLDADPDAAFIAARDLLREVQEQQAESSDRFADSVNSAGDGMIDSADKVGQLLIDAGERSAAAQVRAAQLLDTVTGRPLVVQINDARTVVQRAPCELT